MERLMSLIFFIQLEVGYVLWTIKWLAVCLCETICCHVEYSLAIKYSIFIKLYN